MKQGKFTTVIALLLALCMLMALTACGGDAPAVSEPGNTPSTTTTTAAQGTAEQTLTFTGHILEVEADGSAALMECVGDSPLGERVWVQLGRIADLTPQVGETYTVTYEDMVMLSLPPRITAVTMTLVPPEK